jgi:hypothetical protein
MYSSERSRPGDTSPSEESATTFGSERLQHFSDGSLPPKVNVGVNRKIVFQSRRKLLTPPAYWNVPTTPNPCPTEVWFTQPLTQGWARSGVEMGSAMGRHNNYKITAGIHYSLHVLHARQFYPVSLPKCPKFIRFFVLPLCARCQPRSALAKQSWHVSGRCISTALSIWHTCKIAR